VPLGVFLSGGTDSSVLTAVAAALSSTPVKTFSIGFPHSDGYDEAPYAARVARHLGAEHRECLLAPNALEALPALTRHLDQPLADPSAIPLYHLCQMTREHVTVALAGEGGDELFGGYERYRWDQVASRYARLPAPLRSGVIEPVVSRLPRLPLDVRRDPFRCARKFVKHAGLPPARRYFNWFELMSPEWKKAVDGSALMVDGSVSRKREPFGSSLSKPSTINYQPSIAFEAAFAEAAAQGATPLQTLQYCDTQTMLRDDLLFLSDRVSMAVALEVRVPLLDHVLVEWAFGLPDHMRVRGRTLKYLLKRWLAQRLPPELVYRRKQGFEVPLYSWLTGTGGQGAQSQRGRDWVRELLLAPDALAGGPFDPAGVRRLVRRLEAGERSLALPVYSLLAWELWRREVLDAAPVAVGS
jgi:asparagine synthase (glutamine-hydrolysing)